MLSPNRAALLLAALLAVPVLATVAASLPAPLPGGNGLLMMVHGRFEPRVNLNPDPNGYPMPPPVPEALAATDDDGLARVHVIPFSAATARPVVVEAPRLRVAGAGLFELRQSPNADPAGQRECLEETNIPGYEGPLAACLAFALPKEAFRHGLVTFRLEFRGADGLPAAEDYDLAAHGSIHNAQNGMPVDLAAVDAALTAPTPFVVVPLDPQR